jgi:hypothetical protein
MTALLEHANFTVSDIDATATWMIELFDWEIRWKGGSKADGQSIHVGTQDRYLALYQEPTSRSTSETTHHTIGGLNHIAVVVDDIQSMRQRVQNAGFTPGEHYDYEPGQRFYFCDHDRIEYEVVQYNS